MKTFKRIYIEITNSCNLQCSFCPPSNREEGFMTVADFEKVLQKIKGHGQYIYLHLKGEPLLHSQMKEILDLCNLYEVKVNLTTNGTLIKKHKVMLLTSKALRQVSISLQSYEDQENEIGYRAYLNQVIEFVEEGLRSTSVFFELRLWNLDQESLGLGEAIKNSLALDMIKESFKLDDQLIEGLPKGKGTKLKERLYLSQSYQFQWPDMKLEVIGTEGTCHGLRQQIGILVNGDVVPCCLDSEGDTILGNIFESSMEVIVESQKAKEMIQGFENQKLVEPLCQRCGYIERFKI